MVSRPEGVVLLVDVTGKGVVLLGCRVRLLVVVSIQSFS